MHDDATADNQLDMNKSARSRKLRRWALGIGLTLIGLLILAAPMLFRQWRLFCVPDIGDPFPIADVLQPISEEENAYPLFKEAFALMENLPPAHMDEYFDQVSDGWDPTDHLLNKYLRLNRPALEKWREATEKADYQFAPRSKVEIETDMARVQAIRELYRLCEYEIERLTKSHRPAEAFPLLQASFRCSSLITRKADLFDRLLGTACFAMSASSAEMWMHHPDVTADELRQLLLVVQESTQLMEKRSTTVKVDYLKSRQGYDEWSYDKMMRSYDEIKIKYPGSIINPPFRSSWEAWLLAEPEFSRRLGAHVTASHLAFVDAPRRQRPPLLSGEFFDESAVGVTPAEHLPAKELIELLEKSKFTDVRQSGSLSRFLHNLDREQARNAFLQAALAVQLYYRDHGRFPRQLSDLPPDQLSSLPDDPYASRPMPAVYRRTGSEAVVYSLSTNEIDDGGTAVTIDEASGKRPLDLGIRIRTPSDPSVVAPSTK